MMRSSMPPPNKSWNSTLSLLNRARAGDREALDELFARYVPLLRRWAAGRLPRSVRELADTPDLVQDTMLQVFRNIKGARR
jgi:RNA polymerase sigma-70 factor, ECF subfamily